MPITINEVETEVEVRSADSGGEGQNLAAKTQPSPESQDTWAEIARRERQRHDRTAAWGFDD